jgi:hypothetical protein
MPTIQVPPLVWLTVIALVVVIGIAVVIVLVRTRAAAATDSAEGRVTAQANGLNIGWRVLAVGLSVFSVACLVAVVVVATIKAADTLSTVALALAVISFAAQLIVTLVQAQQAARLNADTASALTEIRTTSASLAATQSGQFETVLQAFIQQARTAYENVAADAGSDVVASGVATGEANDGQVSLGTDADEPKDFASRFAAALGTAIAQAAAQQAAQAQALGQGQSSPVRISLAEWRKLLQTYPSREEGEPVVGTLRGLSGGAMARLAEMVSASLNSLRADRAATYQGTPGQQAENPENQRLIDAGLIEPVAAASTATGRVLYRFTPNGVIAAQLLRGTGERPEWASLD